MSTFTRLPLRLAVIGTAMLAVSGSVFGQTNCDTYGKLALRQMQENEQKKCGFTGPEWSIDLKAHMDWCATVAPEQWKIELQKREQALQKCVRK